MSNILFLLIVKPIIIVVESCFVALYKVSMNVGFAIIGVSVVINTLVLPVYKRADEIQNNEREKQRSMEAWVKHIKKTFKGDERYMMLSTYYREQNYVPIYSLKNSLSILLQIPFFMAAYSFLSNCHTLKGVPFFLIEDLGRADALIHLGNLSVNVLPIVMTIMNLISGVVYTYKASVREKLQVFAIAIVFLALLYNSPSGLVLYWTCNQVYSLLKNMIMKYSKNSKLVAGVIAAIIGMGFFIFIILKGDANSYQVLFGFSVVLVSFIPIVTYLSRKLFVIYKPDLNNNKLIRWNNNTNDFYFVAGAVALIILIGCVIPSALITDSPVEFVDFNSYGHPIHLIVTNLLLTIGSFGIWGGVFYLINGNKTREILGLVYWLLSCIALINYFMFKTELGVISTDLVFDKEPKFDVAFILINVLAIIIALFILLLIWKRHRTLCKYTYIIVSLSLFIMAIPNIKNIQDKTSGMKRPSDDLFDESGSAIPIFNLSKEGNNVIVIMLDRAIGRIAPYIFESNEQLKKQFDGFTLYPNTISFGEFTVFGAPALYGGYEYTPVEINKRNEEELVDKHNEALKVLPVLFDSLNYSVTVCDPPLVNYEAYGDPKSLYSEYPRIKAYQTRGAYVDAITSDYFNTIRENRERNLFFYSIMRIAPLGLQPIIYNHGNYYSSYTSYSLNFNFLNWFTVLENLSNITKIDNIKTDNFIFIQNSTTHEPTLLQLPEYEPAVIVDNSDVDLPLYMELNGVVMHLDDYNQRIHYESNVAALKQIGNWLDYMRNNEAYDNTRIIIVADHGRDLGQFDDFILDANFDIEMVNPLLLVKDFNADGFRISNEFMTNGDTPSIALEGIISNPTNPFTGITISNEAKSTERMMITASHNWDWTTGIQNGTTYNTEDAPWYSVSDNIFDHTQWRMEE